MDVFFYEVFEEEEPGLKQCLSMGISAGFTSKTIQEEGDREPPSPLVSIRDESVIPLSWASEIKGILTRSTGYDHVHRYLRSTGSEIPAGHLPVYCNRTVAEQAMLCWMALLRKLPRQLEQFRTFNRDGMTGLECRNKTLLVVGVGNVGSEIVKIGTGLEMRVLAVDIAKKFPQFTYVPIEEGIGKADIIVCSMNLTPDNENYFNYPMLRKARKGALFVNVARGRHSPSTDLLKLMREGHLGGIALDVYADENDLSVSLRSGKKSTNEEVRAVLELSKMPNVILTPHNAFNTEEAVRRKTEQSVQQVDSFLKKGRFIWPVPPLGG